MRSTTAWLCVATTTVVPLRLIRCSSAVISLVFAGSRLPVGSSQSRIFGIVHERARNRGSLLLAARELAGVHAALMGETDEIEHSRYLAHHVARVGARDLHCKSNVLPNGLVGEQFEILEDDAEVATQRGDRGFAVSDRLGYHRRRSRLPLLSLRGRVNEADSIYPFRNPRRGRRSRLSQSRESRCPGRARR